MTPQPILIVEDEHALGTALGFAVRRIGHLPTLVATGADALETVRRSPPALVVLDIGLPDMSGLDVVRQLRERHPALPVIMITAHGTLEHAISARQKGATEYLVKPLDLRQFEQTMRALLPVPSQEEGRRKETQTKETPLVTLIGAAPSLRDVFTGIARACASDAPVLITGASGTGKSLVTRLIHAHGRQSERPLVVQDSTALAGLDTVSGTVVLEELTAVPAALQSQLAGRVSEGSHGVRWIATSSFEPLDAMQKGLLRPELYYAFSALQVALPPLRERASDIPALAAFFLGLRESPASPAPATLAALQACAWPGNVRELRQVLHLAADLARDGVIYPSHLPPHLSAGAVTDRAPADLEATLERWLDAQLGTAAEEVNYDQLMDRLETVVLRRLLERHEGRPTHLANALRMNRATLRQKLRRLGLGEDEG